MGGVSGLLEEVMAAHGGRECWRAAGAITAYGKFGGLLRSRLPGNKMKNVIVRVESNEQRAVFDRFPQEGQRAVFDRGEVRIETGAGEVLEARRDPRAAFRGLSGLRRNVRWDALDATYFAGYAWWNYLTIPLLLARDGVAVREGDAWLEGGERWRRLEVTFPPELHTHCRRQTFYADASGLIRRHDYIAEPIGRWASAAHYSDEHRTIDGLVFPTRRRVRPRGPGGRSFPNPILVALDIERIEVEA
jgi:hypothetical protein